MIISFIFHSKSSDYFIEIKEYFIIIDKKKIKNKKEIKIDDGRIEQAYLFMLVCTQEIVMFPGDEKLLTKRAGECILPGACPSPCTCNGATVNCSDKKLTSIPRELPIYTSTL